MNTIENAAALIREIDPALAEAFLKQPFHRHSLVTAFHRSLSRCYLAPMADKIATLIRSAIDSTPLPTS